MTLQQLLVEGTEKLEEQDVPDARLDAGYLLMEAFGLTASELLLKRGQDAGVGEEQDRAVRSYRAMIEKRGSRIPLQYILGTQEFMGLEFKVDERVLIPRQDTEDLVELILREYPEREKRVLDMCTGSGCIAVSLAVLGGYEEVTAVDVSEDALKVARDNAARHHVQDRVHCVRSSMFEQEEAILSAGRAAHGQQEDDDGRYHILVSNPPYIPTKVIGGLQPEVREHEPLLALDGREDGLCFYRILAAEGRRFLAPGGIICLEIGYDQGEAVSGLLRDAGYAEIEVIKDTPGLDRIVKARYTGGFHV